MSAPAPDVQKRRIVAPGEWLILLGMALVVVGASCTWSNTPPPTESAVAAFYVSRGHNYARTAFELKLNDRLPVGWMVVTMALLSGSLLLFDARKVAGGLLRAAQFAFAGVVIVLALIYIGPNLGVALALAGSILLIAGGYIRYQ